MFQINFYRRFFDVNTDDFFGKVLLALNPFGKASEVVAQDEDDATELYGFIWITATLIFLMFVSSTGSNIVAEFLHSGKDDAKYEYNFELLTLSISLFYGYTVVVPFIIYAFTTWVMAFSERLSLTRFISIYSYANVLWFPITAVNFVLVVFVSNKKHALVLNILQWVCVVSSGIVTGLSIVEKVRPIILKNCLALGVETDVAYRKHHLLVAGICLAHLLFTITVKVLFFGIKA